MHPEPQRAQMEVHMGRARAHVRAHGQAGRRRRAGVAMNHLHPALLLLQAAHGEVRRERLAVARAEHLDARLQQQAGDMRQA